MSESAAVTDLEPARSVAGRPSLVSPSKLQRAGRFEWTVFGVFATLLALATMRHEMWRDELQAWLIARDSHSLLQLFHALHYEGHPALWYLLLYIPSHLSPNPASMQAINFAISAGLAWLLVSARMLPRPIRLSIVFSYFVFFQYGEIARSYALAVLLLFAAARCLTGEKQHRKLAIFLLALSLNTHVYAAPVAVALAAWAFYFAKLKNLRGAGRLLRDREFLHAVAWLGLSGMLALITVWPAKDIVGPGAVMPTIRQNLQDTVSTLWLVFFPRLPGPLQILLRPLHASLEADCVLSLALLGIALLLLRGAAARIFFSACALMEIAAMAFTVGWPSVYHLGFIFAALIIACMLTMSPDPLAGTHARLLSIRFSWAALFIFLLPQSFSAAVAARLDWLRPYSGEKDAAQWLIHHRLDKNPMVFEPSEFTAGILAYLDRPNAYYPSCRCYGSYEIRDTARRLNRMATPEEMKMVRGNSPLPVILVTNRILSPIYVRNLGLTELHSTPGNVMQPDGVFYIFEQKHGN